MNILASTLHFEAWLRHQIAVVEQDLDYKHGQMRADPFLFFRATFYRWARLWPQHCPELANLTQVLAIGDLHLENFGTWRDAEGRLVWGVNDFDEAHPMSFANDLVRLAVSALLAAELSPTFRLKRGEVCSSLLEGYREFVERGGEPFVLMESHLNLRQMALQDLRQPAEFWKGLEAKCAPLKEKPPGSVDKALRKILPGGAEPEYRTLLKPKGLGSLGRRRYLAFVSWQGGLMAREAKEVAPSAWLWANGKSKQAGRGNPWLEKTVRAAVRCADPYYTVKRGWLVRRLGPDCSRIDIDELIHHQDAASLIHRMGQETANVHLGTSKGRKRILTALKKLPHDWIENAAHRMFKIGMEDWHQFKTVGKKQLSA